MADTLGFVYPLRVGPYRDLPAGANTGLAVIKYQSSQHDDPAAVDINFSAETWDYHTVRLSWSTPDSVASQISSGTRICVTRSTFGFPLTTEDGVKIVYDLVSNLKGNSEVLKHHQPYEDDLARPPSPYASIYDTSLRSGRFYYYSLFFLISNGRHWEWQRLGQAQALVPQDYNSRDSIYDLIPEYYRVIDQDAALHRSPNRDLYRFCSVIGFELDVVRTLAESIEHIYDSDFSPLPLLKNMGEQNFGVQPEGGLGDIRYRALLANINSLYRERGTYRALRRLIEVSTKYPITTTGDINLMVLPDDSAFATGLGSWGIPLGAHDGDTQSIMPVLLDPPWGTDAHATIISDLAVDTTVPFTDLMPSQYPNYAAATGQSKTGMLIRTSGDATSGIQGVMLTCGYGTTFAWGRRALTDIGRSTSLGDMVPEVANPYFKAVKCKAGVPYTFMFSYQRITPHLNTNTNTIGGGVLWYAAPPAISNDNLTEQLSPDNLVYEDHFLVLGTDDSLSATVSNKALTSNVATLTTAAPHGFSAGEVVTVVIADATFDGTFVITDVPTLTTFKYAKTHADVASASATGTAANGGDASLRRQRLTITSIAPAFPNIFAVPYIVLGVADGTIGNPVERVISNCMFYIAQQTGVVSPKVSDVVTPGLNYYIVGPMTVGDDTEYMGSGA